MKVPELIPVKSSRIQALNHKDGALFVRFIGGALWKYDGVSHETFLEGLAAESIGKWFRANVTGKHLHRKLDA